ncbi:MAG: NYN domain-containing protein [Nitrosomonas sp.]|uniref:NYN domain-containing protein n=1 Tax=Nitrosomonas sp. TaxID=42353 RepID=UPI00272FBE73|nr:NYN domain-containing protein [Nitrosomonas sp.]MDP1549011.1 NYN domain-containing protein [Nitrosomonas sp.]
MAELVYVDNSNVFIEGKKAKAVESGLAMNIYDAMSNRILEQSYKIDFGKLHDFIAGTDKREIKRCMLFGSRPPSSDTIWDIARRAGFEVITEDRNVANKEKKIDTGIVAAMTKDAYTITKKETDIITLVAGDADFVPSVRMLVEDGFNVEVVFWGHAAQELKDACSKFIDLNSNLNHLSY